MMVSDKNNDGKQWTYEQSKQGEDMLVEEYKTGGNELLD